ncbi:MAG TPA: hypothetical protein VKN73_14505 [Desulfosalsimonadaceae bacterium]|nr:hypothetical protein [Desulfosalsimonadaceae bacterium]
MADKQKGALTGSEYEAEDVLADAEPWESFETKLVLWSWGIAVVVLVIGLFIVPTSILH